MVGLLNVTLLTVFRHHIPLLFTQDSQVINLVAQTLPICAAMVSMPIPSINYVSTNLALATVRWNRGG